MAAHITLGPSSRRALTVAACSLLLTAPNLLGEGCPGPARGIAITASREADGLLRYHVHNRRHAALQTLVLGTGEHPEMWGFEDNQPKRILSPPGWEGRAIPLHESEYMQIFWHCDDPLAGIAPESVESDFAVEMPAPRADRLPQFGASGQRLAPLDMTTAPFRVVFADGACAWGRVGGEAARHDRGDDEFYEESPS